MLIYCMANKGKVVEKVCECGIIVKGMNPNILKLNMDTHRRGRKHKVAMEIRERVLEAAK